MAGGEVAAGHRFAAAERADDPVGTAVPAPRWIITALTDWLPQLHALARQKVADLEQVAAAYGAVTATVSTGGSAAVRGF